MANYKVVPNQKVVTVSKQKCDKQHLYATINLEAMEQAAQALDAGAFKLWVYFAKNQNGYEFALSSSAVQATFGMKIKQYNNAVDQLIEKGYLVVQSGNQYAFNEKAVITKEDNEKNCVMPKGNNAVITKEDNGVMPKSNNELLPKGIRNNTYTTEDNTIDNKAQLFQPTAETTTYSQPQSAEEPIEINGIRAQTMTKEQAVLAYGLSACANRTSTAYNNCYWIGQHLVKLV